VSSVENSTEISHLKGKDTEPYNPEESIWFQGRKHAFDKAEEYLKYSKTKPSNKVSIRSHIPAYPSSLSKKLKNKTLSRRITKSGPVDTQNNPFSSELAPKKAIETSFTKFVLKPAQFTPIPEMLNPDLEQEVRTVEMTMEYRRGMPNRHDNKVPSYDRNWPEELLHYIEDVEKEMRHAGVVVEQDKKDWLRYYADQHSSDEWTVLETYPSESGSFKDFKEELVSHCPEVINGLEGSIARLDKLCAKSKLLMTEDLSVILEFIRSFKFEGWKLLSGNCISN